MILLPLFSSVSSFFWLACSKRSDSGERCEVKKAIKSRGGLGREVRVPSLTSPPPSFLFFRAPFYFAPLPTIWTPGTGYLLVDSASLFYLVSSRVSGMPRINSLCDPSVLVTKEILSGAEKSQVLWVSLFWSLWRFIIARYSKFTTPPNQQAQISIISLTQHKIIIWHKLCQTDIWKFQIIHVLRSWVAGRKSQSQVQSRGWGKWFAWNLS